MKVKHLLLGIAMVALMASCAKKDATETPTASPAAQEEVAQPEEQPAETVAQPATTNSAKSTEKTQSSGTKNAEPAVNPCEQKVASFESYVAQLEAASADRNGPAKLKHLVELKQKAAEQQALVKDCAQDATYKTRVNLTFLKLQKVLNAK
ncbi:MAG: hypothetical protein LBL74_02895 [Bacteroidales bacterium]|jgi:vacuolar-type H+-ATPase catalytic subunit A/Vma1|nr:hypothetical protein [Bacteroidales bacterium]